MRRFASSAKWIATAVLLLVLTGCAAQSKILTSQPLQQELSRYSALAIDVTPGSGVARNADFEKVRPNLIKAIATKLPGRTTLAASQGTDGRAGLNLKIVVKQLAYTSQGARMMFGISSGKAILMTDIELSDVETGRALWQASTEAVSGKQHGIFGSSTTTQVEALSEQIVAYLQSH